MGGCPVNKLQGDRHLVFMTGEKHKKDNFVNVYISYLKTTKIKLPSA